MPAYTTLAIDLGLHGSWQSFICNVRLYSDNLLLATFRLYCDNLLYDNRLDYQYN